MAEIMKAEVCCINTDRLVELVRGRYGQEGIDQMLTGIEYPINEEYLRNQDNWISLDVLNQIFANIGLVFNDLSPKLFYELGKEVTATQSGAMITLAKWLANPAKLIKEGPKYNRRFNRDQEIAVISVGKNCAELVNYFYHEFYERERKHQCEWTKGILAGIPMLWSLPPANLKEVGCCFKLEDILSQDYSHLKLDVYLSNKGILVINGQEYGHRVALVEKTLDESIFRDVKETPVGLDRHRKSIFTGMHDDISRLYEVTGLLVTKTLDMNGERIVEEGEIYNTPYCVYRLQWEHVSWLRNILQLAVNTCRSYLRSRKELERLLDLSRERLFEIENLNKTLGQRVEERTEAHRREYEIRLRVESDLFQARAEAYAAQAEELAVAKERRHLARELHDAVTQSVFSMTLIAEAARLSLDRDPAQVASHLAQLQEVAQRALDEMRSLVQQLRSSLGGEEGLASALSKHVATLKHEWGITVELHVKGEERLTGEQEVALFRVTQEALNNVSKHAQTDNAAVTLESRERLVSLTIEDHGVGFEPAESSKKGVGLSSMRERVDILGGTFGVSSSPGKGTRIHVEIPLSEGSQNN